MKAYGTEIARVLEEASALNAAERPASSKHILDDLDKKVDDDLAGSLADATL